MQAFTRQLGSESGVQLNILRDNSEIPASVAVDQTFGVIMRSTRGRIDKPFSVNSGNVLRKLGRGESMRSTVLNEAWVHVNEALNQGAYEAVVQRLITSAAVIKYAVASAGVGTDFVFSTSTTLPADFFIAIKHLDCFNDGIKFAFHAEPKSSGGVNLANDKITLAVYDSLDEKLFEFYGSLNPLSQDDYGVSDYLPDLVSRLTDSIEVEIGATPELAITSDAYGFATNGQSKWAKSDVLVCFEENGTAYTSSDYSTARAKLQFTPFTFGYLISAGTQNVALLAELAQLAFDTNTQLIFDIDGSLGIDAAIAFAEQLNFGASPTAHLLQAYYAPLKSDDPTHVNGKGFYGTSGFQVARRCLRNAQTNTKGFAPKNFPIAGRDYPLQRTGIVQVLTPTDQDLNKLARAKINPVLFETYSGGGRFVFRDSLTSAQVESSLKKLIAVADMSCDLDDKVTTYAKDVLQLPMDLAIKRMDEFLAGLFDAALSAGWLVAGAGNAFAYEVVANEQRPYDRMDINYWLHYDGTVRQIYVTQTLTK